ncbi:hypothetical protein SAMN04487851_114116 [Prevotella sp. tc2-28]|uniref:hypothetical protein n=1 Tax=Prevotella sp. tc2-28 TaxID=1761888 RepID=UPI00089698C4|nr:hypothetical protein [Prevotella sp. tc2-28]SEA81022.1 hypothetical protein SAMN04487851_114116 [Prevotella sp. tc2-28]
MAKGSGNTRSSNASLLKVSRSTAGTVKSVTVYSKNYAFMQNGRLANSATKRLEKIIEEKKENGFSKDTAPFKFGTLSPVLAEKFEDMTGIHIVNRDAYIGQKSMFHHRTGDKEEKGKVVPLSEIAKMPKKIGGMDIYEHTGAIIFTDYKNMFVLKPNDRVTLANGKTIVTNHVSSSVVTDKKMFGIEHGYKRIKI